VNHFRQVILGFLAALLSAAVIIGSLSLSFTETGLKLAIQITPDAHARLAVSTMTQTSSPATLQPGETSTPALFTPSITATISPMFPIATSFVPPTGCLPPPGWSPIIIQADDTLAAWPLLMIQPQIR